ncbi:MAG: polysaccharide biosynthesis tyrosine autokinase [Burkholderiaceae bacterium]
MTIQQFLAVLRGRWWLLGLCFTVMVGAAITWSLIRPKMYTASANLMVDVKLTDPVGGQRLPSELIPAFVATQLDLLASERVAVKVVDRLKLLDRPVIGPVEELTPEELARPRREPRFEAAAGLLKRLKAKPASDSNMIELSFEDRDPVWASRITNEFARSYMETSVQIQTEPQRGKTEFFGEQAAVAREELEQAQAKLTRFQQENGITSADEASDVENSRLQDIARELTAVQALRADSASRRGAARSGSAETLPEVLQSPVIQSLKQNLTALEQRIAQRGASLGQNHPEMKRMRQEAGSLRSQLRREISTVSGGVTRLDEINARREAQLRAEYEKQRSRVLEIKGARDQIAVLQRDVESAQNAYENLRQKQSSARIESNVTQSSVVLIAEATPPILPSSPNLKRNALIAAVLSTLFGLGSIFLFEFLQGRVRVVDDLERASGGAVLGTIRALPSRSMSSIKAAAPALAHEASKPKRLAMTETAEPRLDDDFIGEGATARAGSQASAGGGDDDGGVAVAAQAEAQTGSPAGGSGSGDTGGSPRRRQDLALVGGGRDLAALPASSILSRTSSVTPEVVAAFDASHPMLDDMRVLRSQIKTRWLNRGNDFHAFAVVSQDSGEGKSFTAANLAVTFAQIGNRTLLIDADLRNGRLHNMFGLPNDRGLSTMLSLESSPADSLHVIDGMQALSVVPTGPVTHNPSDLLERDNFAYLIDIFRESFDVVVLDTSPVSAGPDASLVVSAAGGYIVVAREHQTRTRSVEKLVRTMEPLGAAQIGSTLIRA